MTIRRGSSRRTIRRDSNRISLGGPDSLDAGVVLGGTLGAGTGAILGVTGGGAGGAVLGYKLGNWICKKAGIEEAQN